MIFQHSAKRIFPLASVGFPGLIHCFLPFASVGFLSLPHSCNAERSERASAPFAALDVYAHRVNSQRVNAFLGEPSAPLRDFFFIAGAVHFLSTFRGAVQCRTIEFFYSNVKNGKISINNLQTIELFPIFAV